MSLAKSLTQWVSGELKSQLSELVNGSPLVSALPPHVDMELASFLD